jgi:hypothetical protein
MQLAEIENYLPIQIIILFTPIIFNIFQLVLIESVIF